jgi:transcriptional regulator with XRE-family HTH domain
LRRWREAEGLSQRALAKLIGCRQGHISMLERGERSRPGGDFVFRLYELSKGSKHEILPGMWFPSNHGSDSSKSRSSPRKGKRQGKAVRGSAQ